MASLETTVGYVAVNFTVAHLRLEPVNASSRWDGSPAAEGAELEGQQRLMGEQAYRDFCTAIQVFILLTSLLCKSNTHQRPPKRADLLCVNIKENGISFPSCLHINRFIKICFFHINVLGFPIKNVVIK